MENKLEIAKNAIDSAYPNVELSLLTGSAINAYDFTRHSDFDIVLIDDRFSGITTDVTNIDGHRIDFTKLNKSNIFQILLNNSYTNSGTIINMIKDGVKIDGNKKLFELIHKKAQTYYKLGSLLKSHD
jgi:hypothetical protein